MISILTALLFQSAMSNEVAIEKSPEVEMINLEIENSLALKKESRSKFLPELSIKTGIGSKQEIDENKESGNFLYLDGKLNLFNGFSDQKSYQIAEKKYELSHHKKDQVKKKLEIEIYTKLLERDLLIQNQELLKKEDREIRKFEILAQKKTQAGLTTKTELYDFEFKENQIESELKLNEIKISEIELHLKKLTGISQLDFSKLLDSLKDNLDNETQHKIEKSSTKKILGLEESILELEVKKIQSAHLPTLDFEIKSGQINLQNKLLKGETEHEALLTLSIPLFSGGSIQSNVVLAQNELEILKRKNFQDWSEFENQVSLAKQKLNMNKDVLVKTEASLKKSIDLEALSLNEFKRGIKETRDLIESLERTYELRRKVNEINFEIETAKYYLNKIL